MCTNTLCICMYLHTTYIVSNIHVIHFIHVYVHVQCISSMCMDIIYGLYICTRVDVYYVHVYYISGMVFTVKCV